MTETGTEPTHTPLYLGMVSEDADCARHGEMERKHSPLVERDERIYATRKGVALYMCPECCIDLLALAGEPNMDPEQAMTRLWEQYLRDDWGGNIERLFIDLGAGGIRTRNERTVVLSENGPTGMNSEGSPSS